MVPGGFFVLLYVLVDQSSGEWQESQTPRDGMKGCVKFTGAWSEGVNLSEWAKLILNYRRLTEWSGWEGTLKVTWSSSLVWPGTPSCWDQDSPSLLHRAQSCGIFPLPNNQKRVYFTEINRRRQLLEEFHWPLTWKHVVLHKNAGKLNRSEYLDSVKILPAAVRILINFGGWCKGDVWDGEGPGFLSWITTHSTITVWTTSLSQMSLEHVPWLLLTVQGLPKDKF